MPGFWRIRLTQLRGASKRTPVGGSRSSTGRPGSRMASGSGAGSGLVPQPARTTTSARGLRRSARMGPEVNLFEPIAREMRVELGRRDVGVPEHLLDGTQVAAAGEQVGREGVPQRVW